MNADDNVRSVIDHFALYGDLISYKGFGSGHINNTYVSVFFQAGTRVRYTHQRINKNVFKKPEDVMENISAVTRHIRDKLVGSGASFASGRVLTVVPARDGKLFYVDDAGDYWRTYLFIENVKSYEMLDSEKLAWQVGEAVGLFQKQLSDYAGPRLHDTIPEFHNMRRRYEQFDRALKADVKGRALSVKREIDFLMENRDRGMILTEGLEKGLLKEGITHNDTKLNNILFDEKTGEAVCVIDLDTVMPGTILFDTGDLIRTATITGEEDETDLGKIRFDFDLFRALISGYVSQAAGFLTPYEKELLAESGRAITQIMAVRFLTDYLEGDTYYKTDRAEHNRDRARTQIALMQSMDTQWDAIMNFLQTV